MPSAINQNLLFQWLKHKDKRAIEAIYDHYAPVLYGFIFRITNQRNLSEDILLKTFTYLWNEYDEAEKYGQNICFWMLDVARRFTFEALRNEDWLPDITQQADSSDSERLQPLESAFFRGMNIEKLADKYHCTKEEIILKIKSGIHHLKREYLNK